MVPRVLLVLVLAFGVLAASAQALSSTDRITANGIGPVKVGMTVAQVEKAAGRTLKFDGPAGAECRIAPLGDRLRALFTGSVLTRVQSRNPKYGTSRNIRVGMRTAQVLVAYPSATRSPHKYVRGGEYLKVTSKKRRIVFETSARGRVTEIIAGRTPEVDYVEGCA